VYVIGTRLFRKLSSTTLGHYICHVQVNPLGSVDLPWKPARMESFDSSILPRVSAASATLHLAIGSA